MKNGLVSVFIPSYNYQRYLGAAIDSILAQTYTDWELIIVDDASSDDSPAIIERYQRRYPDRIRSILLTENVGQSEATNIGLRHANGEFVALLAADDVARPERLAAGVALLRKRPDVAAVFSKVGFINADGRPMPSGLSVFNQDFQDIRWRLLEGNFICGTSAVARLSAMREIGGYNRTLSYVEDYDLWMRLLDRYELLRVDDVWVDYRLHGNNLSLARGKQDVRFGTLYESVAVAVRAMHRWPLKKLARFQNRPDTPAFDKEVALVQIRLAEVCLSLESHFFQQMAGLDLPSPKIAIGAAYEFVLEALRNDPDNASAHALLPRIYEALGDIPRSRGQKSVTLGEMGKGMAPAPSEESKYSPEAVNKEEPESPREPSYSDWLKMLEISKIDGQHYDNLIQAGRLAVKFHLVTVLAPGLEGLLVKTINSLVAQLHQNMVLTVVATVPAPPGFVGARLRWRQTEPSSLLDWASKALLQEDAQWVGLIQAGDTLAPGALLVMAEAIERNPKWQVLYSDDDLVDEQRGFHSPCLKPEFDLTLARGIPYVRGLVLARWDAFALSAGMDVSTGEAADYDLLLKVVERAGAEAVGHIAIPQFHRLNTRPASSELLSQVLANHLSRTGTAADIHPGPLPESFKVQYRLDGQPLVSVIMPTRDRLSLLSRALESLLDKTAYPAFELLIVDHASTSEETRNFLSGIASMGNPRLRVLRAPAETTLAGLYNLGAREARGEHLLFLHDDIAALHGDWLERMVAQIQRPGIGAVGARLVSANGRLQHAGIALGVGGVAEIIGQDAKLDEPGHLGRYALDQEVAAVSAACMLIRRELFDSLVGFDGARYPYFLAEVDLCLRLGSQGWRIVWTPQATLLHDGPQQLSEGIRSAPLPSQARATVWQKEQGALLATWLPQLANDPHYPRAYSLAAPPYQICRDGLLARDPLPWRPAPLVLAQPADREACGHYRVSAPLLALARRGLVQGWDSSSFYTAVEIERMHPDVFVFQRPYTDLQLEQLQRCKTYGHGLRLFDMDDLMTQIPPQSVHRGGFPADLEARLKGAARLCDRIVVSTAPLAHAFRSWNEDIRIAPNRLPGDRWLELSPARRSTAKPRVGWAGALGHEGDLALISQVVEALADEVDWIFLGKCPEGIRRHLHEHHEPVSLADYPAALARLALDVAIAPLEINAFNEAKSSLKILEYGVLGYPVVCTDITPYQGEYPVTRVRNRPRDWIDAIRALAHDPARSEAEGNRLREHVVKHWILDDHLDDWVRAWLP